VSGFKVQAPPPPPPAVAPQGAARCGAKFPGIYGVYCERPAGHDGGHLSESQRKYWQAAS